MFSEFFCSCFLYPAMYDGAKLGAGKIWSFLSDKKKSGQLSSTDIELYNLIEKVSRKLAGSYSDDSIYSVCEILCNTWLRKRSFGLEDIREALKLIGIAHSKEELVLWKEFLDRNISQITLELKKAGHTEPDDEKKYVIKNQQVRNREYIFDLSDCPVKIKEELSEIVLATDATDFCDENWLYAEILIRQIAFA